MREEGFLPYAKVRWKEYRMEKIKEGQKETKRGKKKWLILLLLLVALGSCMAWSLTREDGLFLDPDQSEGTLDGLSREEIQKLMNDKVEEGRFMISINTQPVFADGKSEGTLRIENSPQNRYLMIVKIYRYEGRKQGELLYESGAIKPGNKIETARLKVELPKGEYPVIVYFEGYDEKSRDYVGKAGSELSILIQK